MGGGGGKCFYIVGIGVNFSILCHSCCSLKIGYLSNFSFQFLYIVSNPLYGCIILFGYQLKLRQCRIRSQKKILSVHR